MRSGGETGGSNGSRKLNICHAKTVEITQSSERATNHLHPCPVKHVVSEYSQRGSQVPNKVIAAYEEGESLFELGNLLLGKSVGL